MRLHKDMQDKAWQEHRLEKRNIEKQEVAKSLSNSANDSGVA
ncbi:hypothetical protein [Marinagarivorans algicola]|nr:hypothetical protein [Marinagarivorans algicola]